MPQPKNEITVRTAVQLTGYHRLHIYGLLRDQKVKSRKAKFGEILLFLIDRESLLEYCRQQERPVNDEA